MFEFQYSEDWVVLFKCHWFDTRGEVRVVYPHGIVEVKHRSTLALSDVFILASQAQQVLYMTYPSKHWGRPQWWIACKIKPKREFVMSLSEMILQANEEGDNMYQDDHTRTSGPRLEHLPDVSSHYWLSLILLKRSTWKNWMPHHPIAIGDVIFKFGI